MLVSHAKLQIISFIMMAEAGDQRRVPLYLM